MLITLKDLCLHLIRKVDGKVRGGTVVSYREVSIFERTTPASNWQPPKHHNQRPRRTT